MVLETPAILGFAGIADRARELFRAGFDAEDSRLVVTASPLLLGTNITQAVETLRTAGFSKRDVLALSRSVPGFLGSRTCALLDELAECGFPRPECVRLIVAQPGLLAYDLPQRLGQLCELGFSHKEALGMARQLMPMFGAPGGVDAEERHENGQPAAPALLRSTWHGQDVGNTCVGEGHVRQGELQKPCARYVQCLACILSVLS